VRCNRPRSASGLLQCGRTEGLQPCGSDNNQLLLALLMQLLTLRALSPQSIPQRRAPMASTISNGSPKSRMSCRTNAALARPKVPQTMPAAMQRKCLCLQPLRQQTAAAAAATEVVKAWTLMSWYCRVWHHGHPFA